MKFNKPLIITAGIAIGISVMMSVNAFTIQSNVLNAVATFQQFFVTSDGNAPSGSNQIVSFNQGLNNKVVFAPNSVVLSGIIASGANQALGTDSNGNITSKTIAGGGNSKWTGSVNIINTNTGNVGIGISNPTVKLHVVGNSIFSGNIFLSPIRLYQYNRSSLITGNCITINSSISSIPGKDFYGNTVSGSLQFYLSNNSTGVFYHQIGGFPGGCAGYRPIYYQYSLGSTIDIYGFIVTGNRVGIGTDFPTQTLHVVGNLRVQGSTDCILGSGNGATNCTSDQRLKKDIVPIRESLDKILSLTGVYYNWKDIARGTNRHIGFLAQNVEKVFPELVIQGDNGYKMLSMEGLIAPLVNAIKEQQVQINELKKELQLLKK